MRVLYEYFSYPNHWRIAKHLQKTRGWEPVYWCSSNAVQAEVTQAFPGISFQDMVAGRRAIHTTELAAVKPQALDKEIIDALAIDQMTCLKILGRHDTTGYMFSLDELMDHYYELIKFWLTVITEKKIEMVVSWAGPHGTDYVLYMLCKHLGIKVLFLDFAYAITKDTHLIARSIEDKAAFLREKLLESKDSAPPSDKILSQIQKVKGDYRYAKPDYMSAIEHFGEPDRPLKNMIQIARHFGSTILHNPFKRSPTHFKFKRGTYKNQSTSGNNLQYYLYYRRVLSNGRRYKKIYDKYVVEPDFSKKYLFFAAPYQPEAATLPDAGVYNAVPLMLEMLSEGIPEDWVIYYKEHPTTFDSILGGDLYRNEEFYKRVSEIPKVKMVNYKLDTFQMIDKAQVVASATGTVGWEAVVRGKCSLTFGEVWYNPCEGVYHIQTREDLKKALDKVISGYKPNSDKLLKFAGIVDRYCFHDIKYFNFPNRFSEMSDIDKEMQRYGDYFACAYARYYVEG